MDKKYPGYYKHMSITNLLVLIVYIMLHVFSEGFAEQSFLVKKVYNGQKIKLSDGTKIQYAGISVPDKKSKPFFNMCKKANRELVANKVITYKAEVKKSDDDGKLLGYVYVGETMVNAELIRLGYALIFPPSLNDRYKKLFLKLQTEARQKRRGFWAFEDANNEPYYAASKGMKIFHRPQCFHVKDMFFDDRIIFRTKDDALDKGFTQCWRCCPLFVISPRTESGSIE